MSDSPQVLVLGGGIAGLATAYELHQQKIPLTLLEAATRVGGVVFSEEVDGFNVDGGPDSLLIQKAEGIKLCQELGLGTRLVPTKLPRLAFIQRLDTLHGVTMLLDKAGNDVRRDVAGRGLCNGSGREPSRVGRSR